MKRYSLIILVTFLLIFELFLVSAVVNNEDVSTSINQNNIPPRKVITGNYFDSEGRNLIYSQQGNLLAEQSFDKSDYSGYIIEFEKPSLIEKKTELEKMALKNDKFFLAKVPLIKEFFVTSDNIASKVQRYESDIITNHEILKNKINAVSDLNSEEIVFNEYSLVFNGIALNISDAEAKEIEKISGVKKAWSNYKVEALLMDSVPLIQGGIPAGRMGEYGEICSVLNFSSYCHNFDGRQDKCNLDPKCQWNNENDENIFCEAKLVDNCLTGEGVKIAIIDTGVDYTHPDLGECFGEGCKVIGGYDLVNNDNDPKDDHGHGTHVAATAAGNGVLRGVAPDAQILAYKVLDSGGSGSFSSVIAGVERAVIDQADIISMSLGGGGNPDDPLSQAVDNAVNAGVVAVIAAGNSGPGEETIGSPGTARKAITVGATDKQDYLAYFSSRGPVVWEDENGDIKTIALVKPDIVAPGVDICAAQSSNNWLPDRECLDENHIAISGTSMATPHVAGVVALLKQKNPNWTPEEIKSALKGTAKDLGLSPIEQGAGRVDVAEAVKLEEKMPIALIYSINDKNKINIFGTAKADNFEYYKVYLDDNEVKSSNSQIDNGLLYSIDIKNLKDGENVFKLGAKSTDGRISEDFVLVDIENIKFTSLFNNDIYRKGDLIPIKAEIVYDTYDYNVYYSKQYEENWVGDGIIKKTEGDIIAEWDTSLISDGFYKIKFIFDVPNVGTFEKKMEEIYFDSTLKEGWPQRINFDYFCESERSKSESLLLTSQDKKIVFMTLPKKEGSYAVNGLNNELLLIKDNKLMNYKKNYAIVSKEVSSLSDFCYYYWAGYLEPVVEDINNDGSNEIVVYKGGNLPKILVYSQDGSLLWEKEVGTEEMVGGNIHIPLIGDLNNDGRKEIIAFNYGDFHDETGIRENASQIFAFESGGSLLWSINIPTNLQVSMLMADLNNDGNKEIVIKSNNAWERKIMIINQFGEIISIWDTFEKSWGGSIEGSLAIGNFDEDDDFEIVMADPSENAGGIFDGDNLIGFNNEGVIYIYNMDGSIVDGWPRYTEGIIFSSPVVGDIDNDGKDDIVVGLQYASDIFPEENLGGLYAFDKNGNILPGWPYKQGYNFWSTPALGDLNNDEKLEIATSRLGFKTSLLYHNGSIIEGWPRTTAWNSYYSDMLADVNGDGKLDVLTTSGGIYSCDEFGKGCGGVYAWDINSGFVSGFPKVTEIDAQGPLNVFDNEGSVHIAASSDFDMTSKNSKYRGSVYVWELNAPYNSSTMDWPMFMHDAQHTGCYDCDRNISQSKPIPTPSTSLSKIENLGDIGANITLSIKIQKFENNSWLNYKEIVSNNYNILPKSSLNLTKLFNEKNTTLNTTGNYRLNITAFDSLGQTIASSGKEFKILTLSK